MVEQDVCQVAEFIDRCLGILVLQKEKETSGAYDDLRAEVSAFNRNFPMP